jgi:hypothetical protein
MSEYDFKKDSKSLHFNLKHNGTKTEIRVDHKDYSGGKVSYGSSFDSDVTLHIGNGSPSKYTIESLQVTLNESDVSMTKQADDTWKGTLTSDMVAGAEDAKLVVSPSWAPNSGMKDQRDDPVIIVNPTPNP